MVIRLYVTMMISTARVNTYSGPNAVNKFMEEMLKEVKYCKNIKSKHFNKDMVMTKADK